MSQLSEVMYGDLDVVREILNHTNEPEIIAGAVINLAKRIKDLELCSQTALATEPRTFGEARKKYESPAEPLVAPAFLHRVIEQDMVSECLDTFEQQIGPSGRSGEAGMLAALRHYDERLRKESPAWIAAEIARVSTRLLGQKGERK